MKGRVDVTQNIAGTFQELTDALKIAFGFEVSHFHGLLDFERGGDGQVKEGSEIMVHISPDGSHFDSVALLDSVNPQGFHSLVADQA